MALSFPYALAFLADHLRPRGVKLDIRRSEELSGSGDGRYWASELARPLWQAELDLVPRSSAAARAIDAKLRALMGTRHAFLWADPSYEGPVAGDPGAAAVVASIGSDRTRISLSGLPAGFAINPGDRVSISHSTDRVWMAEFSEAGTANGSGVLPLLAVFPYVPFGVNTAAAVEMRKPYFKAIIPPGGHGVFSSAPARVSQGGSLTLLQRP